MQFAYLILSAHILELRMVESSGRADRCVPLHFSSGARGSSRRTLAVGSFSPRRRPRSCGTIAILLPRSFQCWRCAQHPFFSTSSVDGGDIAASGINAIKVTRLISLFRLVRFGCIARIKRFMGLYSVGFFDPRNAQTRDFVDVLPGSSSAFSSRVDASALRRAGYGSHLDIRLSDYSEQGYSVQVDAYVVRGIFQWKQRG